MAAILPKSPTLAAGLRVLAVPLNPSPCTAISTRVSPSSRPNSGSDIGFGEFGRPRRLLLAFAQRSVDFNRLHASYDGGSGAGGAGGGGESGDGKDKLFFSWYLLALDKHPVITKAITSVLLTLVGDLICQIFYLASLYLCLILDIVLLPFHSY